MAKINAINNKSQELTIDPGASGDSFVQFDINGTGEFRIGVDDDVSDAFKISQGSALGTNDTFMMTDAGERRMPLQPAFLARRSTTVSNITGDGSNYTIIFDSEIFDQNGDYNNSTGYFTAPVTGRYFLNCACSLTGLTSSHTRGVLFAVTSNGQFYIEDLNVGAIRNSSNNFSFSGSCYADMDASDTVYIGEIVSGGTKVVDVRGAATSLTYTWFGGYLAS